LLVLGTTPGFMDVLLGQDATLLAFLVAVAFWQLDEGRDASAGVALGLALIKFQLVLPLVLTLCVAGRKRVLSGFVSSALASVALSAAVVGWKGVLRYPAYLLSFNQSTGLGIAPQLQTNLRGLLTLVIGRSPYPGRIHWLLAPVAVAAMVYAGLLWRKAGPRFLAEGFALAALAAIVTSYYAYSYDLLLLIVPLLAMRTRPQRSMEGNRAITLLESAGLAPLLLTPAYWFAGLGNQCLMTLPLVALMVALWMRLRAAREIAEGRTAPIASVLA